MTNRSFRNHWRLDSGIVFLNHGSFGATPAAVMDKQREIRNLMEKGAPGAPLIDPAERVLDLASGQRLPMGS